MPPNVRLQSAFQSDKPVTCNHWQLNQAMKSRAAAATARKPAEIRHLDRPLESASKSGI